MKSFMLATAILCALLVSSYHLGFRLNTTPSLARGLYRLSDELPQRGDIVAFCLSGTNAEVARERGYLLSGSCPSGLRPLVKLLAGFSSDMISVSQEGISCGPAEGPRCLWPVHAYLHDSNGRPLSPATIEGTVPDGMAVVLTLHPGGFDSRYFGAVPVETLQKVEPILTF